ncbi:hypothetical protein M153_1510008137 [Pseudoloma neurophilia]|uniref:Uncharacterized protein n=1 Tax=Pseudoloma neurophilia TaxID=146866 RepID=A0A0R0M5T1_9MICR|nr:hypothetical protein M153_1510008137 [Pseudoloma neurophilia]
MEKKKLIIILGVLAAVVIVFGGVGLFFWFKSGDKESKTETKKTTPTAAQSQKEGNSKNNTTPVDETNKTLVTNSQDDQDNSADSQDNQKETHKELNKDQPNKDKPNANNVQRDPKLQLFENTNVKSCMVPIFNVLFRLDNSFIKFIETFKEKEDSYVKKILLKLKEKVNDQKYPISLNTERIALVENLGPLIMGDTLQLNNKPEKFLLAFLTLMMKSDFDQAKKYFLIELKDETQENKLFFKPVDSKITLSLFKYEALKIVGDQLSLIPDIENSPKLMFVSLPNGEIFRQNINAHLKIKRSNSDVYYYLKGIIYVDAQCYYSFFIENSIVNNQESEIIQSILANVANDADLLVYELQDEEEE